MTFSIDEFRAALTGDGARPNLFQVILPFPTGVNIASTNTTGFSFMCRGSQIPGMTQGTLQLMYWGREVKLAGNKTFAPWTVTVMNDESFALRNAFEQWMNGINSNEGNLRATNFTSSIGYGVNATVNQYGKQGSIIQSWTLVGAWPTDLAPIDLEWSANDTLEEFVVTFDYQYWTDGNTT